MKRKLMLTLAFVSLLYIPINAQSDISDLIFEASIDDFIMESTPLVKAHTTQSTNFESKAQKTKEQKEIDAFIEQALEKAKKEEEKKANEKKRQEELKIQEELKKQEERIKEELKIKDDATTILSVSKATDSYITGYAKTLLGIPYVWGGASFKGFDCSGFVQAVYNKFDIKLSRTTYTQIKQGYSVALADIRENDLIFFDTRSASALTKNTVVSTPSSLDEIIINEKEKTTQKKLYPKEPTHVGIYIGDGKIIHASSSKGQTVIDTLDNGYFKDRIVDIRRYK